jgi:hypothetical protein
MKATEAFRRGVSNEGGLFSPYYLFDLMQRKHGDELDLDGRERERRMLPRLYRKAMARLVGPCTLGEIWAAWYRELFEALGFNPQPRFDAIATPMHGRVPVTHVANGENGEPLVLMYLHPLGTNLDNGPCEVDSTPSDDITTEPIARAFELALDNQDARWGILSNGSELRLYRKRSPVSRQYLKVDFDALFDAGRDDEWTAFWGLFRKQAFEPADNGKCLLDRVLEESQQHATRIAEDLRQNVVEAVEALIQGVLDERENARLWGGGPPDHDALRRLLEESLYFLYRLLFVLYAESRDILPVGEPGYRDTYSLEHLRDMAEREFREESGGRTYYIDTLRTLFRLLRKGFRCPEFDIPSLGGHGPEDAEWERLRQEGDYHLTTLFDGRRTLWLDECRIPDRALRTVIRELSLSRPRRRTERRERYSYADLGVDQLGSIYEGLLAFEPAILTQETVIAKVKGEERLVGRREAEENQLQAVEGSRKSAGSFVLRLWGGRRKGSGSYYTRQELTAFLVREALEPQLDPLLKKCAEAKPEARARTAERILEIKVCDPAMGSGAFLIQACRYLADAYARALGAGEEDGRVAQEHLLQYKRMVAERCLYGVDVNALAVELTKVSLWLETLSRGRPLSFLDARLRCGNSLVGAPLDADQLGVIPPDALKVVTKEPTDAQKARAAEYGRRNRKEIKEAKGAQFALYGLSEGLLHDFLEAYARERAALDESDAARPDTDAHRLREEKEQRFRAAYEEPQAPIHHLHDVCDVWCAAWFWPEEEEIAPFTTEEYRDAADRILKGDHCDWKWLGRAREIAREQHFFHWELEFPEVFLRKNPGFDAMVGNPPWEGVTGAIGYLAGEFDPLLKTLRGQERDERIVTILHDPEYGSLLRNKSRKLWQYARYASEGPMFKGLIAGELNTFAPFTAVFWKAHRVGGAMALIVKDAFHLGEDHGSLRAEILKNGRIRMLATSDNERKIFDAHHLLRFDLMLAARGESAGPVPFSVHRFRTAAEVVQEAWNGSDVPLDLMQSEDGSYSEPIPEPVDEIWAPTFGAAKTVAKLGSVVRWSTELHTSGNKSLWTRGERIAGSPGPVLAIVNAFDALSMRPLAWLKPESRSEPDFEKVLWTKWRVCVRNRANQKDERCIIAALIPPHTATCHALLMAREPCTMAAQVILCGLANSLLLDFLVRPFVGSNIQQGMMDRLPWAILTDDPIAKCIAEDVLRLTCIHPDFDGLPEAAGMDPVTPARTPADRALCRAQIDARVAHLYSLSEDEFTRVLAWFRLLDQDQPPLEGEPRSTITRDLVMLEYLHQAGRTSADLEARVRAATALGAVAYLPSRRGGNSEEEEEEA